MRPRPATRCSQSSPGKTARAIERQLRRLERAVPTMEAEEGSRERQRVQMLRHELVQLCLQEVNRYSGQGPARSIEVALVTPQNFRPECRPPGPDAPHTRIRGRGVILAYQYSRGL